MAEKPLLRVAAVQIAPDLDTPGGTISKVLAALAAGMPQARLTREAKASLQRLAKRSATNRRA